MMRVQANQVTHLCAYKIKPEIALWMLTTRIINAFAHEFCVISCVGANHTNPTFVDDVCVIECVKPAVWREVVRLQIVVGTDVNCI